MKIPKFLFETGDVRRLQDILGEKVRVGRDFLILTQRDVMALQSMMESELGFDERSNGQMMFRMRMCSQIVELHEKAETVADKANVLTLIMTLHHWGPEIPAQFLSILK